jgi:steroid 5-alpha reductase family enzyme
MNAKPLRFSSLSRANSLFLCCVAYAVAAACAFGAGALVSGAHPLAVAAAADVAATLVVFIFSVILDNSSVYDPYWSVAPIGIILYFAWQAPSSPDLRQGIVIALVCFWAIRLTWNWLLRWQGLKDEDWRYSDFRSNRAYWAVSFAGFHFFPTVAVFAGCLPLVPVFISSHAIGVIDALAVIVTCGSIIMEMKADRDLRLFRRKPREQGELLTNGIWSWCRHPNYFGEVAFWWGIGLFGLAANLAYWWTMSGALIITALFLFISLPMMDRHMLKRYPGYSMRIKTVPAFLPFVMRRRKGSATFSDSDT